MLINGPSNTRLSNNGYFVSGNVKKYIFKNGVHVGGSTVLSVTGANNTLKKDYDSPWLSVVRFIHVNDSGEVVAEGKTIYGEKHAMFLTPAVSSN